MPNGEWYKAKERKPMPWWWPFGEEDWFKSDLSKIEWAAPPQARIGEYAGQPEVPEGFGETVEEGEGWKIVLDPSGYYIMLQQVGGEWLPMEILGRAPEEAGISPYQQWSMGFQGQQLEQQAAMEQARLGMEERGRLAELTASPRDWIEAWIMARAMPQAQQAAWTPRIGNVLAGQMPYEQMSPEELGLHMAYEGRYKPVTGGGYPAEREAEIRYGEDWQSYMGGELAAYEPTGGQLGAELVSGAELQQAIAEASAGAGGGEPSIPQYPSLPEELAELMPWVMPDEMISPEQRMKTPSGQWWAKTPWTEREMALGLGEFTGRPALEVLQHMATMLPEEPRGARTKRWRPARQMA